MLSEVDARLSLSATLVVSQLSKKKSGGAGAAAGAEAAGAGAGKKLKGNAKPKEVNARVERALVAPTCGCDAPASVREERFYLTTAINYTNGPPHMGHAYEAVTSDVIARFHRQFGRDVFFLTGADEHGQKVEQSAEKEGVTPQAIADRYSGGFRALNTQLSVSNDAYIRTTTPHHHELAGRIWERVKASGDIYLKDYVGWYNVHEEQYVTDAEAEACDFKDSYGRPFEKKAEEAYFFKMSKYQAQLLKYITEDNPGFIRPEVRKREILSFLSEPLLDLCISRTVCQWGIPCPPDAAYAGEKSHVMYVWFDALSNYLSGINYLRSPADDPDNHQRFWPAAVHVIGKDIIRFHCVIWCVSLCLSLSLFSLSFLSLFLSFLPSLCSVYPPTHLERGTSTISHQITTSLHLLTTKPTNYSMNKFHRPTMLMSADVPLPRTVFGHGFVVAEDGLKMSKSIGNVVDPVQLLELYPADALRFYIARSATFGRDLPFSERQLCETCNAALKDGLGNLVHRATSLCSKFSAGKVPAEAPEPAADGKLPLRLEQLRAVFEVCFAVRPAEVALPAAVGAEATAAEAELLQSLRCGDGLQLQIAADVVVRAIDSLNQYLQEKQPWALPAKDPASAPRQRAIVRTALEGVYAVAHFLAPYCPTSMDDVFHKLGVQPTKIAALGSDLQNLPPGTQTYIGPVLYGMLEPGVGVVAADGAGAGGDGEGAGGAGGKNAPKNSGKKAGKQSGKAGVARAKASKAEEKARLQALANAPAFCKMEFRVGRITKVWEHPDSEKLFCEEIDLGEDAPRQIASGLRKHYELADLQDRLVVVCCNLKPRPLAGFSSNGMVICATTPDKTEMLDPPQGSVVGERLGLKGRDPDEFAPEAPNKVARKKLFEAVAKTLLTNQGCLATWDGHEIHAAAGPCTVPSLAGAPLS